MPLCVYRAPGEATGRRYGIVTPGSDVITRIDTSIADLLRLTPAERTRRIADLRSGAGPTIPLTSVELLAPVDRQEIWAAGVTYARSRDARMEESTQQDVYDRVYHAQRPEIFFKSQPDRCIGPGGTVAIRHDSAWNVPEPELAVFFDTSGAIAGFSIGNDVSSRSIEGENPLYLPQAKVYTASCALGPWLVLLDEISDPMHLNIRLEIERPSAGGLFWADNASTSQLRRTLDELGRCLYEALEFPDGAVLLTGTCIVPPAEFTLAPGDMTHISIEGIGTLTNTVRALQPKHH